MSNRLFQGLIYQMKDAVNRIIGVIDDNGVVVACSELVKIGEVRATLREEIAYASEGVVSGGYTYRPIGSGSRVEYAVFVEGEDKMAEKLSAVIAVSLGNLKSFYDEKYDKNSLIKNIILDNILPSDIYIKSKELHLNTEVSRVVYLIKFQNKGDAIPFDMVLSQFPDKSKDNVISIGENDIVLVHEITQNEDTKELERFAMGLVDTLASEFYMQVSVGIGTSVENIKDLARSYKEAQVALEVGKIFDNEKAVNSYETLGIGRLIYQLPTTLCEMFLQEVFKKGSLESLDKETLATIQCFFENNLNVSETSRKLFVHRNTLVYRLEKIRKLTGLDLREFEHAITFKVALMVKKYLASKNNSAR
ncbi:MAG: helix-turn-helix domain-containing protein [Clostridia bacterium]|nr:helix-turn-helix domain-containing protein [Clostridia bacterium]